MGCQTAIAGQIRAQGGDYLLALKSNHKKAYAAVKAHFHQHIEHQGAWRTAENFSHSTGLCGGVCHLLIDSHPR
jgi:predicted transposase YbfD/YdcC